MKKLLINDTFAKGSSSPSNVKQAQWNERLFNILTYTLVLIVVCSGVSLLLDVLERRRHNSTTDNYNEISLDLGHVVEIVLPADADVSRARDPNCRFWDCLNLYRCGHDRLTVYVYPLQDYVDASSGKVAATLTREYYQILETLVHSPYYASNPNEACLFVPSLDLLNQNLVDPQLAGRALAALDHWDDGENHLLFNMVPGSFPTFNRTLDVSSDRAMVLGGGFDSWTYRPGFDVAIPVWSPALDQFDAGKLVTDFQRKYMLVLGQLNALPEHLRVMQSLAQDNVGKVLLLQSCREHGDDVAAAAAKGGDIRCNVAGHQRRYEYPQVLAKGTFCLLSRSLRLSQPDLMSMLAYNCIPVVASDNYVLPFEDVLDWSLALVRIRESELHYVVQRLEEISNVKIYELQQHGRWLYQRYFKDLRTITLTALEVLEGRIFPHRARSQRQWNTIESNFRMAVNPLFLPLMAPKTQGFTAVILTYDRVESLFTLIQQLALVPSLQSILVVWNNQRKSPPHLSTYPTIVKPLKVIQTRANKLSNRFYPYAEIETEAILTIDDDIIMLTADELDFGFEVWREFPDRIVGFPSRVHVWNNETMRWHYESEWTNQISMVLTGAAFHHKFWSHMYTYAQPGNIKEWVDEHMNCEDIAMNFLVANITNKPPIKVTPRKKFKCPECTNTEMLSADLNHMRERSACIDRFARIYGHMPLRSVEFRADPVLFKDNFPEKLKRFNDVGSL